MTVLLNLFLPNGNLAVLKFEGVDLELGVSEEE